MANAALVLAARGRRHHVTEADEDTLEDIFCFFETLRSREPSPKGVLVDCLKVLTFPELLDWFTPRFAARPVTWSTNTEADDRRLRQYVVKLHRLGIPTFFLEQPNVSKMKLLLSVSINLPGAVVPESQTDRAFLLAELKRNVGNFVVQAAVEAMRQIFGEQVARQTWVAIFDASGHSLAAKCWKLSMRVCFVEIAVDHLHAKRMREVTILRLREHWLRQVQAGDEGWAAVLEVAEQAFLEGCAQEPEGAASSFWEAAIDSRSMQQGATHRLVYCDVAQGDPLLPEERPLLPYTLLLATTTDSEGVKLVEQKSAVPDDDWIHLGSSATHLAALTPICSTLRSPAAATSRLALPAACAANRGGAEQAHQQEPAGSTAQGVPVRDGWFEYRDESGKAYYHCPQTNETVWELPTGKAASLPAPAQAGMQQQLAVEGEQLSGTKTWRRIFSSEHNREYFQNIATGSTAWDLPEGAVVVEVR